MGWMASLLSSPSEWVIIEGEAQPVLLKADYHFGIWSLLPAAVAIALCLISREPLLALFSGIVVGRLYDGQIRHIRRCAGA